MKGVREQKKSGKNIANGMKFRSCISLTTVFKTEQNKIYFQSARY